MNGIEIEKTLAEYEAECKALVQQLRKDKSLTKITRAKYGHRIDEYIKNNKDSVKFKCVIFPNKHDHECGLFEDVIFDGTVEKHWKTKGNPILKVKIGDTYQSISHGYGNWGGRGTIYINVNTSSGQPNKKIELFLCVPKGTIKTK